VDRKTEYQALVSSAAVDVDAEGGDEYADSNAESGRLDEYDDVAVALRAGIEVQRIDPDCSRH